MQSASEAQLVTDGDKKVASLRKNFHDIVSQVSACQIKSHDGMRQGIAFIGRHVVDDTVSRIQNYSWKVKEKEKLVISHRYRVSTYSIFSAETCNKK